MECKKENNVATTRSARRSRIPPRQKKGPAVMRFWNGRLSHASRADVLTRLQSLGILDVEIRKLMATCCCASKSPICTHPVLLPLFTEHTTKNVHIGVRRCYCSAPCDDQCISRRTNDLALMSNASVYGVAPLILDVILTPTTCGVRLDVVYVTVTMLTIEQVVQDPNDAVAAVAKALRTLHRSVRATLNGGICNGCVLANPLTGRVVFMDWSNAADASNQDDVDNDKLDTIQFCRDMLIRLGVYDHPIMHTNGSLPALVDCV